MVTWSLHSAMERFLALLLLCEWNCSWWRVVHLFVAMRDVCRPAGAQILHTFHDFRHFVHFTLTHQSGNRGFVCGTIAAQQLWSLHMAYLSGHRKLCRFFIFSMLLVNTFVVPASSCVLPSILCYLHGLNMGVSNTLHSLMRDTEESQRHMATFPKKMNLGLLLETSNHRINQRMNAKTP